MTNVHPLSEKTKVPDLNAECRNFMSVPLHESDKKICSGCDIYSHFESIICDKTRNWKPPIKRSYY